MPKQAIIHHPTGQRAAVAAFMLLLLASVAGLAYAAAFRPALQVNVAGLAMTFPSDWRRLEGGDSDADRARFVLENERRPALRAVIRPLRAVNDEGQGIGLDATGLLKIWFPMMVLAPLPEGANLTSLEIRGLDVAHWTGVLRSQLPIFGQSSLSVASVALVTDNDGRIWSIIMRDDNYQHEDPAQRVVDHRERFLALLDTVKRTSSPEPHP